MIESLRKKGNNKGFSLVELIVVILIIAILGVAVAPQIMKWVGTSRESTDKNNAAGISSSMSVAVADYLSGGSSISTVETFKIDKSGNPDFSNVSEGLKVKIEEVFGKKYPGTQSDDQGFTITITTLGAVTVSCGALSK